MRFNGREFQRERVEVLRKKLRDLRLRAGKVLSLASFYFVNDRASVVYTKLKAKIASELGVRFVRFGLDIKSKREIDKITELIKLEAAKVDGVLVQKPSKVIMIPDCDRDEVFYELARAIPIGKDVDVVSPISIGRLVMINDPIQQLWPATVRAVVWVLSVAFGVYGKEVDNPFELIYKKEVLKNRRVVVVGNRGMVGSMVSLALSSLEACVIGGDKGVGIKELVREGEVVISCTGVPSLIKSEWINEKQIVVDVGFGEKEGRVMGDFEGEVYEKVKFAAGVPGGVGPVTVVGLMENLWKKSKRYKR